jgi:hypothetical protein
MSSSPPSRDPDRHFIDVVLHSGSLTDAFLERSSELHESDKTFPHDFIVQALHQLSGNRIDIPSMTVDGQGSQAATHAYWKLVPFQCKYCNDPMLSKILFASCICHILNPRIVALARFSDRFRESNECLISHYPSWARFV